MTEEKTTKKPSSAFFKQEAILNVVHVMASNSEAFGGRFMVIENDDLSRFVVLIDKDNVCRVVSEDIVLITIQKYISLVWNVGGGRKTLSGNDSKEILSLFKGVGKIVRMKDIEPVGLYKGTNLCWSRLEWEIEEGETPAFDEMFGRMTDPKIAKAWIGSLFHAESDRAQYLWIFSDGGDGKSSLADVICRIIGVGVANEVVPQQSDKFWTSGIVGKRLVVFADVEKEKFVGTGMFKSLTGDSAQRVEFKGKNPVRVEMNPKFLFLSNKKPELTRISADIRRAIIIGMQPAPYIKDSSAYLSKKKYDKILWGEAPYFLHECLKVYKEFAPDNGKLPVSKEIQETVEDILLDGEEENDAIFQRHFHDCTDLIAQIRNGKFKNDDYWNENDLTDDWETICKRHNIYTSSTDLIKNLSFEGLKCTKDQQRFIKFMLSKYQAKKIRVKKGKQKFTFYLGMKAKTMDEKKTFSYQT